MQQFAQKVLLDRIKKKVNLRDRGVVIENTMYYVWEGNETSSHSLI